MSEVEKEVKEKKDPTVTDLVKQTLATKLGKVFDTRVSQDKAWESLKVVMETIVELTKQTGRVGLPGGMGSFKVKEIAARERRVPTTGQTFMAPASRKIRYYEGSSTKE